MFGKPEWFVKKKLGWGLRPKTWQGWVYTLTWAGIIIAPSMYFQSQSQFIESGIWTFACILALSWDVWTIHSQLKSRSEVEDFFYIGEEGGQEAETDNLQLREKS